MVAMLQPISGYPEPDLRETVSLCARSINPWEHPSVLSSSYAFTLVQDPLATSVVDVDRLAVTTQSLIFQLVTCHRLVASHRIAGWLLRVAHGGMRLAKVN